MSEKLEQVALSQLRGIIDVLSVCGMENADIERLFKTALLDINVSRKPSKR